MRPLKHRVSQIGDVLLQEFIQPVLDLTTRTMKTQQNLHMESTNVCSSSTRISSCLSVSEWPPGTYLSLLFQAKHPLHFNRH